MKLRSTFLATGLSLAFCIVVACGDDTPESASPATQGGQDAGGNDGSAPAVADSSSSDARSDQSTGGSQCHDLTQQATQLVPIANTGAAPAPTGGPLEDGTFVMTAVTFYNSLQTLQPPRITIRINTATGKFDYVTTDDLGEFRAQIEGSTTSSKEFNFLRTCAFPVPEAGVAIADTGHYSATPGTIKFYRTSPSSSVVLEQVFTKK